MNSMTPGRSARFTIRRPAMVYGETARSAPAWISLEMTFSAPGASDDEQARIQGACGEGDVDVLGIGVDGADKAFRPFDAGSTQDFLCGAVAVDDQVAVGLRSLQGVFLDVDDDDLVVVLDQFAGHHRPHAAVAAHDEVPG